jgi:hypothetical protein
LRGLRKKVFGGTRTSWTLWTSWTSCIMLGGIGFSDNYVHFASLICRKFFFFFANLICRKFFSFREFDLSIIAPWRCTNNTKCLNCPFLFFLLKYRSFLQGFEKNLNNLSCALTALNNLSMHVRRSALAYLNYVCT